MTTVYVIRTLDQGNSYSSQPYKYVWATDDNQNDFFMVFILNSGRSVLNSGRSVGYERDKLLSCISGGDTLLMNGEEVIRNLTFEHEKARFNQNCK